MAKDSKSKALSRKKEEKMTDNCCKSCGSMKHKTSEHVKGGGNKKGTIPAGGKDLGKEGKEEKSEE